MLTLTPRIWPGPERDAPMAGGPFTITDRAVSRDGIPFIPVSGELHFSRVPRERWTERLRQMKAGGITIVATYVFWIHHAPARNEVRFDGDLDLAAFLDTCAETGLDVALRIGPWAHGECRNGGFPDWVQAADVAHRTDDPAYLALVAEWFGRLGDHIDGHLDPVVAVQLENELYDQPQHIATLKGLAREAGITAPLWTATAWGGAQLPEGEVFPLYGGYGDGFWNDPDAPWDATFRAHYFFSDEWDDPGVGADVRAALGMVPATARDAATSPFPPATCELAGGMATAYHRRPRPIGLDVAAVAHTKIGNGSAWQGYYMYAGGTNPGIDLEESQATGYPNDMTRLSYDFHAPIGQAGDLSESSALLRGQHAFLASFGDRLLAAPSSLPDDLPSGVEDTDTLRWAARGGFLFVAWHQPHVPLETYRGARFRVGDVELPSRPVDIPPGTLARWPLDLRVGDSTVRWATASALTVLSGERPTLVLVEDAGIPVEIALDDAEPVVIEPSLTPLPLDGADLLVVPAALAADLWVRDSVLHLSAAELSWDADGPMSARSTGDVLVEVYDAPVRIWRPLAVSVRGVEARSEPVPAVLVRPAGDVPADYGFHGPRHSAPSIAAVAERAAVHHLDLPAWALDPAHDAVVEITWAGDVGHLRVDGMLVDDRYGDGSTWRVSVQDLGLDRGDVTLSVLPLSPHSTVWRPPGIPLEGLDVRVVSRGPWRQVG